MPITLDDFKEGGSLRNFVTQVGLLGKIGKEGVDQAKLLNTLINSVTMVGAYTDSNKDGKLTKDDSVSEKFSNKKDDESTGDNDNESETAEDNNSENAGGDNVNENENSEGGNTNENENDGGDNVNENENSEGGNTNEEEEHTGEQDDNTQEEVESPSVDDGE
jgi:hypothetical protein